jgi:hypothetical protein
LFVFLLQASVPVGAASVAEGALVTEVVVAEAVEAEEALVEAEEALVEAEVEVEAEAFGDEEEEEEGVSEDGKEGGGGLRGAWGGKR